MTVSGDFHGVSILWPSKTLQKVQSLLNAIGDEEGELHETKCHWWSLDACDMAESRSGMKGQG